MKKRSNYGGAVHLPGIDPKKYVVSIIISRRDDEPLSDQEWAMCERAVPIVQTAAELLEEDAREEKKAKRAKVSAKKRAA